MPCAHQAWSGWVRVLGRCWNRSPPPPAAAKPHRTLLPQPRKQDQDQNADQDQDQEVHRAAHSECAHGNHSAAGRGWAGWGGQQDLVSGWAAFVAFCGIVPMAESRKRTSLKQIFL